MIVVMKKFHLIILVVFYFMNNPLNAEPILGILKTVHNNNMFEFSINSNRFRCKNYGIIMIDEVNNLENTCKKRLIDFKIEHPQYSYFSQMHLKRYQQYHLNIIDGKCILYSQGRKSLSELLLENGLAIRDSKEKNSLLEYKFKRAQFRAKKEKKGIYSDSVLRSCINVLQ